MVDPAPLSEAPPDCLLRVVRVEVDPADMGRVKALGICVGRQVTVVQRGDPLVIRIVGTRLGISSHLASAVFVKSA
ncbi:FeoA family protein [Adhaeretor mobilis]|uniref:FeoA domain protein n=1 Tax=Adhaeretor mobilis TaxID=1930276 RepID=A0A517MVY5_9BACT|nr:FeoA family protein [Adhaeretor mobilis]QDS99042.1 FeoA domain protein [Adhaeretor mobilis]